MSTAHESVSVTASSEASREPVEAKARQRTLLLVDDEASILSSLKRVFRRDGYTTLTATSGTEGLALLAQYPVDVILSDQRMPGMTGIEFMREARRRHPGTVRITLSGYTDLESIIEAVNEGSVYKFLTKPWDDELLRKHVAQAFEQTELAADNRRLGEAVSEANRELAIANQRLERLVDNESALRKAMQSAAGASRDALDAMPIAVFGIGEDGALAYVNRLAVRQWPQWTCELGSKPSSSMRQLLDMLGAAGGQDSEQGMRTIIDGTAVQAWLRSVAEQRPSLGQLLVVQLQPHSTDLSPGGQP